MRRITFLLTVFALLQIKVYAQEYTPDANNVALYTTRAESLRQQVPEEFAERWQARNLSEHPWSKKSYFNRKRQQSRESDPQSKIMAERAILQWKDHQFKRTLKEERKEYNRGNYNYNFTAQTPNVSDIFSIETTNSESVAVEWMKHYASGLASSYDESYAITTDNLGNVYVTGSSWVFYGSDYKTIKYNSYGEEQWVTGYNGHGNSYDEATSIAVDVSGNVYVTGRSYGAGTYSDYATIKYNSSGVEQWVARYNGLGDSSDEAHSIAVDGLGNVYVTGSSFGSGTDYDYTTIKYDSSGNELWVRNYNGPGNSYDMVTDMALDTSGNVYVTGFSYGAGTYSDYATIKYNSSGVEQWVARYNGPANSADDASAITIDHSGNVYVTGSDYDSGTLSDYATIKYNSSGVEQWVSRYSGPGNNFDWGADAITTDTSGNVYVTGSSIGSGTSYDYTTIKYDSLGNELWVRSYNGPGNSYDRATSIAVDASGNVYVTGVSYGAGTYHDYATIKYNSLGVEQWVARYNGPENYDDGATDIAVDASGNVYVTGSSCGSGTYDDDYATIKYNSFGEEQWVKRYNRTGNSNDYAADMAVDASGNVYITGSSGGSGTSYDYATIKYNTSGVLQWVQRYNGPGNSSDGATDIAVDASGNVYITGSSVGSGTYYDYATIKYNTSGVLQWVQRYNGPGSSYDYAYAIVVDNSGNVYVTGVSYGAGTYHDYATIKYNTSGVLQWVQRYNGPGNSSDGAIDIAVDASGNVYVTGSSEGSETDYDYTTIKYNSSGVLQWVQRYNGPGNSSDEATDIAVDASGNVYITGYSVGSGTYQDYATIKYNSLGVEQWVARYNGPENYDDGATDIAVDASGNVYVTGWSYGWSTSYDYATIKYNTSGVLQWVQSYNGPGNSSDAASSIAVDASGNVYVGGGSEVFGHPSNFTTIKYDTLGIEKWVKKYNEPGCVYHFLAKTVIDIFGNVYVAGTCDYVFSQVYITIKYNQYPNGSISGKVFNDTNGDGTLDPGEQGLPGWVVQLSPYDLYATSDTGGNYSYTHLPPSSYTVNIFLKRYWQQTYPPAPGYHQLTLSADQTINDAHFGNQIIPDVNDLSVSVAGGIARPGFQKTYGIMYENKGTAAIGTTVEFVHPLNTTFLPTSTFPPQTSYDPDTRTVTWALGSITPGTVGFLVTAVQIATPPTVNNGDQLTSCARVLPSAGDADPADNEACETQVVQGSYDPNDKLVVPLGLGEYHLTSLDTSLVYMIRFQNTGTDTAFNIVIKDTLDQHLDMSTVITGASSHPYTFEITGSRELKWTFANVNLPDSNINESGSHGFVSFSVRPMSSAEGNVVNNTASIYFDFNLPVQTNRVTNYFGSDWTVSFRSSWNMVSLPISVLDNRKSTIFPESVSDAFFYNGGYEVKDSLFSGKGFWLKFSSSGTHALIGASIDIDTFDVVDGWNMIGSISKPFAVSSIISEPPGIVTSDFFGYTSSYVTSDTIYPGNGYWVKVNQDGQLILSSTTQSLSKASIKIVPTSEMPPSPPWESTGRIELPKEYRLEQNYPNPFNPITIIKYGLPLSSNVKLRIFNVLGQVVATLKDEEESAGYKQIEWNSSAVASGIYFYRLEAMGIHPFGTSISDPSKSFTQVRKMILIK